MTNPRAAACVLAGSLGLVALAAAPSDARAAGAPSLNMGTWRPPTDPNASLVLEPAATAGPGVFSVAAYGSYAFHPIATNDVRPVAHSFMVDAIANFGIGTRLAVGVDLPVFLYQTGSGDLPANVSQNSSVPTSGLGDLGVSLKATLVRDDHGGFGLAAVAYGTLPTGDKASFTSERAATGTLRLLAEYTVLIASLQASIGYTARAARETWPEVGSSALRFGNEIPWTAGLLLRPAAAGIDPGNRQHIEIAFHGWLPAGPAGPFGSGDPGSAKLSPVLLALGDRIDLGHYRDTFLTLGGEIGLNDAIGVPTIRGVLGIGWSPRKHDQDNDGVTDDYDRCPGQAGTKDGCPE